ncbi:MAG: PhnD/SsuA/transferrin family substrate-binding protein [Methylococcaceae bacterium]|nr:PhnD/SsuA/transferrin family substrate-binding protein [Methylococcaceae bacterium]
MSNSMLQITPAPPTEARSFSLHGNIDAHAGESLQGLHELTPGPVRLDFSAVQRVNSMGLALLLKLFEHCDGRGVSIQVVNANRMIAMLFRMTGMERYLAAMDQAVSEPLKARVNEKSPLAGSAARMVPGEARQPQHSSRVVVPKPAVTQAAAAAEDKLRFLANMQNSQQLNGWYFFNTYLQRRLSRDIHLDLIHAAWDNELQPASTNLVFARPFQATRLLLEHDFQIVARPREQADEIVLLVRAQELRQELAEFAGGRVVTESPESFVYLLGRFLLDESGLASEDIEYLFTGHEIKAVRALLNGEADLLFMQAESFKSLSALTRSRLRLLDESDSGLAFHLFCIAPACSDLLTDMRQILKGMSSEGKGRQVLDDLGMLGWDEPEPEEIDMLTMLYKRYVA